MLISLEIFDFSLINHQIIEFKPGLNVITGETGAGKSTIIDALNILFGQKTNYQDINLKDTGKTIIEASFKSKAEACTYLSDIEIDPDNDTIIISREITLKSSKTRVNGSIINSQTLAYLKEVYLNFHGQHETLNLLKESHQLSLLDDLGDSQYQLLKSTVNNCFKQLNELKNSLKQLSLSEDERLKKLDYANFCFKELNQINIQNENEDKILEDQKNLLLNKQQIQDNILGLDQLLKSGVSDHGDVHGLAVLELLDKALVKLSNLQKYNLPVANLIDLTHNAIANLEEVMKDLNKQLNHFEHDGAEIEIIQERLHELAAIKRKYGPGLADVLAAKQKLETELTELNNFESSKKALENKICQLNEVFQDNCQNLSKLRKSLANTLSKLVSAELTDLEMKEAAFEIKLVPLTQANQNGLEHIEFLISPNKGTPFCALVKIASGGELSRIMLALKTVFAKAIKVNSLVFDEIDAGLSGKTVQKVADKLKSLSKTHQLIVVTHQPIIASIANHHLLVSKKLLADNTTIQVQAIHEHNQRLKTLANMVSNSEDKAALNFAKSLLQASNQ